LDDGDPALFPKLTEQQRALLEACGQVRPVGVGDVLFSDGDVGYDPMVIVEGQVDVLVGAGEDERLLVGQRAGDLMVELNLFTGQPVGATGIVREAGSVVVVPAEEFRALLGRELVFGDFVMQLLFRRRRALERLRVGIRIVGSRFDRDTHRVREFAARNRVVHDWVEADEPRAATLLGELDPADGPVVLLGGGRFLRNPSNADLADALGLQQGAIPPQETADLVIVGAGPAGLAAAVYGAAGGMTTVVVDAVAVGGQAATSARIENYLGFPAGLSGAELAERGRIQAEKFNAQIMVPRRAVALGERAGFHLLEFDARESILARSVILALGVQYRRLPIPRLVDYEGLGVAYATDTALEQLRPGDDVVVVGGANSAGQAALAIAEGRRVYLIVRAETLVRSMARYLRDRIALEPSIEVLLGHEVRELAGDGHVDAVTVENLDSGTQRTLAAGVLVVLIGAVPRTDWLAGTVDLDADGFILTGPALGSGLRDSEPWSHLDREPFLLETSRPGVFAVGDVRSGSTKMVAPAAGEGGMAVRFAAEHLARSPAPGDRRPRRAAQGRD
jgi:thioredoxin reductase (NADPH)